MVFERLIKKFGSEPFRRERYVTASFLFLKNIPLEMFRIVSQNLEENSKLGLRHIK